MHIKIRISKDDAKSPASVYRIDCSKCGAVDKGYANQVTNRANEHNRKIHSGKGQVIKAEE